VPYGRLSVSFPAQLFFGAFLALAGSAGEPAGAGAAAGSGLAMTLKKPLSL